MYIHFDVLCFHHFNQMIHKVDVILDENPLTVYRLKSPPQKYFTDLGNEKSTRRCYLVQKLDIFTQLLFSLLGEISLAFAFAFASNIHEYIVFGDEISIKIYDFVLFFDAIQCFFAIISIIFMFFDIVV